MIHSHLKLRVDISEIQKDIHYYISSHDYQKPEFLVMNLYTLNLLKENNSMITGYQMAMGSSERLFNIPIALNPEVPDYIIKIVG